MWVPEIIEPSAGNNIIFLAGWMCTAAGNNPDLACVHIDGDAALSHVGVVADCNLCGESDACGHRARLTGDKGI
jgi:hypothetical protein